TERDCSGSEGKRQSAAHERIEALLWRRIGRRLELVELLLCGLGFLCPGEERAGAARSALRLLAVGEPVFLEVGSLVVRALGREEPPKPTPYHFPASCMTR